MITETDGRGYGDTKKIPIGRQASLYGFVVLKHDTQVRKYTGEPYHTHVRAVAEMADGKCTFGYEIGLCHDLFEDTECTYIELRKVLVRFDYSEAASLFISKAVLELSDHYTHEVYPKLNREDRKALEAKRLHNISHAAQTVKYCDLIHNTSSIVTHDPKFAVKYLQEKEYILSGMDKGEQGLYIKALKSLNSGLKMLLGDKQ